MTTIAIRIFIFTFFPLLLALLVILVDGSVSSKERKLEMVLVMMFAIGVAGSGIANFVGHLFLADVVADSIGWDRGSPFQLEMAFANLAIGLMGIGAVSRRDGFREATVLAVTVLGVGATIVHLMDIAATGNLAPGNTVQNIGNLARPAVLIWALATARRTEASPQTARASAEFHAWRAPLVRSAAPVTIATVTGFALGFGLDQLMLISFGGMIIAASLLIWSLVGSPAHRVG